MNSRRYFSPEFKTEAASTVLDSGFSVREACDTFDVGATALRRWVKQLREERNGGVSKGNQPMTPEQRRIRELETQVQQLKQEKDVLKKATAFFVREQTGQQWFTKRRRLIASHACAAHSESHAARITTGWRDRPNLWTHSANAYSLKREPFTGNHTRRMVAAVCRGTQSSRTATC